MIFQIQEVFTFHRQSYMLITSSPCSDCNATCISLNPQIFVPVRRLGVYSLLSDTKQVMAQAPVKMAALVMIKSDPGLYGVYIAFCLALVNFELL